MTSADLAPGRAERPSTALRRALGHEWRQHRDVIAFHGVISMILIQLAWLLDIPLGVVLILLAARLPADFADTRPGDGRLLRSSLGISRADAVRARFLLVTAGQLLLMIAAAWIILITDHAAGYTHWSSFDITSSTGAGPAPPALWEHLVDVGLWSGAIVWTHALIGGEASRLGTQPTGRRALALYLGICLLAYLVLTLSMLLISSLLMVLGIDGAEGHRFIAASTAAQAVTVALTLGGGSAALLLSRRRWIRRA